MREIKIENIFLKMKVTSNESNKTKMLKQYIEEKLEDKKGGDRNSTIQRDGSTQGSKNLDLFMPIDSKYESQHQVKTQDKRKLDQNRINDMYFGVSRDSK